MENLGFFFHTDNFEGGQVLQKDKLYPRSYLDEFCHDIPEHQFGPNTGPVTGKLA